jgi:hypothetical protein
MSGPPAGPVTARHELARIIQALVDRLGWWFVPASVLFWTVLWPLGLVWLLAWLVRRELALRRSGAVLERRAARLLRWYPVGWRERYGAEFTALLCESLRDGRGGLRMTLDVARAGLAARLEHGLPALHVATLCLTVCWIPLFPQGLVPLVMMQTGVPSRSWFLALYLPAPWSWLTAGAMVVLGLSLLLTGVRLWRTCADDAYPASPK